MESELERRFRLVTEAISELFWIVSACRQRTRFTSSTYERVYGQSLEVSPPSLITPLHHRPVCPTTLPKVFMTYFSMTYFFTSYPNSA